MSHTEVFIEAELRPEFEQVSSIELVDNDEVVEPEPGTGKEMSEPGPDPETGKEASEPEPTGKESSEAEPGTGKEMSEPGPDPETGKEASEPEPTGKESSEAEEPEGVEIEYDETETMRDFSRPIM
jgi:hypothetical protein